ncbi:helix-turn-helix domain-containing protein [Lentzea sp. JNUCC 0626]|uniref:helix-turn-helix domain-containing protein n=1 Tax=Lentzea sp. JNUCC 0626 TaxID=3367513 RepID=UPI0037483F59
MTGQPGKHPVDELHQAVGRLLTVGGMEPTTDFLSALEEQRLLPWAAYTELLFEIDTTLLDRRRIKALWTKAGHVVGTSSQQPWFPLEGPRRLAPVPPPAVMMDRHVVRPMLDSELQASSESEFTALLRTIQQRSGRNPAQVGKDARIPRSQAYSLISRATLPTRPDQVRRFADACGLPYDQVQRVMRLWSELHERKNRRPVTAPPIATTVKGLDATTSLTARSRAVYNLFLNDPVALEPVNLVRFASGTRCAERVLLNGVDIAADARKLEIGHLLLQSVGANPTFAQALRALRVGQGHSLAELARRTHYSKGYLSKIENAQKPPAADLVRNLERALDAQGILLRLAGV